MENFLYNSLKGESYMKRIFIILNLVFLFFLTSCNIDEIITDEVIQDIIETTDKDNKIFINVISKDTIQIPLKHKGKSIKWEYDNKYLSKE